MPATCMHLLVAAAQLLALGSCVSTRLASNGAAATAHPDIHRIAVAPLANLSEVANAGGVMTDAILTELYSRRPAAVVDGTRVAIATYRGAVERSRAQDLGKLVEADAVLYGTVLEYSYFAGGAARSSSVPSISVTARLVSTKTGAVLWAASIAASRSQLLTYDSLPLESLALGVARDLVDDLGRHVPPLARGQPAAPDQRGP